MIDIKKLTENDEPKPAKNNYKIETRRCKCLPMYKAS